MQFPTAEYVVEPESYRGVYTGYYSWVICVPSAHWGVLEHSRSSYSSRDDAARAAASRLKNYTHGLTK